MVTGGQVMGVIITLFAMLIVPVVLVAGLFVWFRQRRKSKNYRADLMVWSVQEGYSLDFHAPDYELALSTYNKGVLSEVVRGTFHKSNNHFMLCRQEETRGDKDRVEVTYRRTVLAVDIPDTQLQMLIQSKAKISLLSGGNMNEYKHAQRVQLEGDFGEFFDVFMPGLSQSETLSMLTPDSMLHILTHFARYDIEINRGKLFIYFYEYMPIVEVKELIAKTDVLLQEMRLRKNDTRKEKVTNALVARTATDPSTNTRPLAKNLKIYAFLAISLLVITVFLQNKVLILLAALYLLFVYRRLIQKSIHEVRLRRRYKKVIRHSR